MHDPDRLTRREALAAAACALGLQALAWWRLARGPAPEPPGLARLPIDLNLASAAELEALPGVGPASAAALIRARPIRSEAEALEVLGAKRWRALRPLLSPAFLATLARPDSASLPAPEPGGGGGGETGAERW